MSSELETRNQEDHQALEAAARLAALDRVQAVIEFELDGTIIDANQNFLEATGYALDEIRGQHHRMFCDPGFASSAEYARFWERLGQGHFQAGEFKRLGKGGKEIWIQASYSPIMDADGRPFKVVKYATDVTEQKLRNADYEGQIEAIGKSQAVIEFDLDGTIRTANQNFLATMGYSLEEIRGKHHRIFCEASYASSAEYASFWQRLGRGEYEAGEFKRIAKNGSEIWIQASYNPIMDPSGKALKVVKYATDVTEQKLRNADYEGQIEAIGKSQAVIEFDLDGTIRTANQNFLATMGYSLEEIRGKHHRIFCEASYASSPEYESFWERLGRGEYEVGEFKRVGKGGKEIWIQATYNPIIDLNGKPFKVVKYASDVTEQVQALLRVGDVLEAVENGDLTATMTGEFQGRFAKLRDSMNNTVDKLCEVVGQIRAAASQVRSGATEINDGNADLNNRTQQQAVALEQTAATVEELTSTVKKNAENAQTASTLSDEARDLAVKGGKVVNSAVDAVTQINTASRKIVDIIGVIDEIAFQTNLLALNASVEAARAGEQGRGFAVVAAEVRNLAQRSAESAKEIKGLINESVEKVQTGSTLVTRSGETLSEIIAAVERSSQVIAEIAAASREQASGIEQVSDAITQMDENTQRNAALVEEATSASENMRAEANTLEELVAAFKIAQSAT